MKWIVTGFVLGAEGKKKDRLKEEEREHGTVSVAVYKAYFFEAKLAWALALFGNSHLLLLNSIHSSITIRSWPNLLIVVAIGTYAMSLGRDFWLAKWTSTSTSTTSDHSFVLFYGGLSLLGALFLFLKEVLYLTIHLDNAWLSNGPVNLEMSLVWSTYSEIFINIVL